MTTPPDIPMPVPAAVPVPKMSLDFLDVMAWHKRAAGLSPSAPSFVRYQVIIKELDAAVALLKAVNDPSHGLHGTVVMEKQIEDFLAKHAGAPYG